MKLQDPSKSKSTAVMNLTQLSTGLRQDIAALIRDKPIRSSKPAWSARGKVGEGSGRRKQSRGVGRAKMKISYYDFPAAFPPSPVAPARTKQEQPMAMEGRGFGLMKIDMKAARARFCACVADGAVKGKPWFSKQC